MGTHKVRSHKPHNRHTHLVYDFHVVFFASVVNFVLRILDIWKKLIKWPKGTKCDNEVCFELF